MASQKSDDERHTRYYTFLICISSKNEVANALKSFAAALNIKNFIIRIPAEATVSKI